MYGRNIHSDKSKNNSKGESSSDDDLFSYDDSDEFDETYVNKKNSSLLLADGDDENDSFSEPEQNDGVSPPKSQETMQLIVEKILGRKFSKIIEMGVEEELFFIKWRGLSYFHVSWERREDIEKVDPQGKAKIKRFLSSAVPPEILGVKKIVENGDENSSDDEEIEYFQPELVEVQRVIACDKPSVSHSQMSLNDLEEISTGDSENIQNYDSSEDEVKYLVKWRALPYNECSWETWNDLKPFYVEVWKFWNRQDPPSGNNLPSASASVKRPAINEYKRLEESPKFFLADSDDPETALTLRDYQVEGVNWLIWNWWQRRPCILADEMGLGKTIQSVGFLHQLRTMPATRLSGPFLIIAPLSLISQWHSEVTTWSSKMNCIVMHGNTEARALIQKYEFYYQEPYVSKAVAANLRKNHVYKFDLMLTTYEVVLKDIRLLAKIPWKVLILDEAHRLKNPETRVFETLSSLQYDHCVLLTGTPLQNKTEELWALLHFADKVKFSDPTEFVSRFGDLKDAAHVAELHSVLKPYLLRRVKEDVEKSLPPKEETIIEVTLTPLQRQFYRAIYERNTSFLFKGTKSGNQPSLMNVMMELRKCCNHPYLIRGVEERLLSEIPPQGRTDDIIYKKMVDCSGKLVLLDKLLPRLYEEGHKVLIFSQMVRVLNILEDFLRHKKYAFERLDGNTRANDRNVAVQRFCNHAMKRFIMLLSTKAGGLGLNLTAADTVIIFDSDWNPQNDIQAQARAHRIGQTRAVMVYRLLTSKTYEMHMFHRASLKLGLDRAVLAHARNEQDEEGVSGGGGGAGPGKNPFQAREIEELLKRGAYDVFREDDSEPNEFVEADIDSIMTRRAHKVSYDNLSKDSLSASLGGFSKASFVSKDESEDVDIDDPDFWRKAIGLTETASIIDEFTLDGAVTESSVVEGKRVRIATQIFGRDDHGEDSDDASKPAGLSGGSKSKKAAAAESKSAKEVSKVWGPHSRDRVVKAVISFGLGRWDRIRAEGGAMKYSTDEISAFASAFILQCALTTSIPSEEMEKEPECVREAVQSGRMVEEYSKSAGIPLEIPSILLEEKFLAKMKQGAGKKYLQKLDLILKLGIMVLQATDKTYAEVPNAPARSEDLDTAVETIGIAEVAARMSVPERRAIWAMSPYPWWDKACEQHLLIGVFVHGLGNYIDFASDRRLCFREKYNAWNVEHGFQVVDENEVPVTLEEVNKLIAQVSADSDSSALLDLRSGQRVRITIPVSRECPFRGVYSQRGSVRWIACYSDEEDAQYYVGTFDTDVAAALAYDKYVRQTYGVEGVCNFLPSGNRNATCAPVEPSLRPLVTPGDSKYNGVRWCESYWVAERTEDETGDVHVIGSYKTELEAAYRYDMLIRELSLGDEVNFPDGLESELDHIVMAGGVATTTGSNAENGFSHEQSKEYNQLPQYKEKFISRTTNIGVVLEYYRDNDTVADRVVVCTNKPPEKPQAPPKEPGKGKKASVTANEVEHEAGAEGEGGLEGEARPEPAESKKGKSTPAAPEKNEEGLTAATMPDSRFFNRMFAYLVTYVPPPVKPPKGGKGAGADGKDGVKKRGRPGLKTLGSWDISSTASGDTGLGGTPSYNGEDGKLRRWSEERKKQHGRMEEITVLSTLHQMIDLEAIYVAVKKGGLRMCEVALLGKMTLSEMFQKEKSSASVTGVGSPSPMDLFSAESKDAADGSPRDESSGIMDVVTEPLNTTDALTAKDRASVRKVVANESGGDAADTSVGMEVDENSRGEADTQSSQAESIAVEDLSSQPLSESRELVDSPGGYVEVPQLTESESQSQASVPPVLDVDSLPELLVKRVCSGLVLFTAPVREDEGDEALTGDILSRIRSCFLFGSEASNSEDNTPKNSDADQHLDSTEMETPAPVSEGGLETYTWEAFTEYIGVESSAVDVIRVFYEEHWLPFCLEISLKTVAFNLNKRMLPNPYKKASDHHLIARGLCHLFLRRQQLMRAIRNIFNHNLDGLMTYLKGSAGRDLTNMPPWWCPWIHDVGLLLGCMKHGWMILDKFITDKELPFTLSKIRQFVRLVFIDNGPRVGIGSLFSSEVEAEKWVQSVSMLFPERDDLISRVARILTDLTTVLPSNHPCCVFAIPPAVAAPTSGNINGVGSERAAIPGSGEQSIDLRDAVLADGLMITRDAVNNAKGVVLKRRRSLAHTSTTNMETLTAYIDASQALYKPNQPLSTFSAKSKRQRVESCRDKQAALFS